MTKSEIIVAIAYIDCANEVLIERDLPDFGLTVGQIGPAGEGLKTMAARFFAEQLEADTADLGDSPDARLFERLHLTSLQFHREVADSTIFEAVAEDAVETHRKVVGRLRQISSKLGIAYQEPQDPFLNSK